MEPAIVLSTSCVLARLFCTPTQGDQPLVHMTDEEPEAQKRPRSVSPGAQPGSLSLHLLIVSEHEPCDEDSVIVLTLQVTQPPVTPSLSQVVLCPPFPAPWLTDSSAHHY